MRVEIREINFQDKDSYVDAGILVESSGKL